MKNFFLLLTAFLLFGCLNGGNSVTSTSTSSTLEAAKVVAKGDFVSVDYIGSLTNGTVFDTSIQAVAEKAGLPPRSSYAPLTFNAGTGQMIKGFDDAVIGMKIGEQKTVTLPPSLAYGEINPSLIFSVPVANITGGNVTVGMRLTAGNGANGRVIAVRNGNATIDFNQELAGQTLVFNITVRNVVKK